MNAAPLKYGKTVGSFLFEYRFCTNLDQFNGKWYVYVRIIKNEQN